jgi:hypothetical protein
MALLTAGNLRADSRQPPCGRRDQLRGETVAGQAIPVLRDPEPCGRVLFVRDDEDASSRHGSASGPREGGLLVGRAVDTATEYEVEDAPRTLVPAERCHLRACLGRK